MDGRSIVYRRNILLCDGILVFQAIGVHLRRCGVGRYKHDIQRSQRVGPQQVVRSE